MGLFSRKKRAPVDDDEVDGDDPSATESPPSDDADPSDPRAALRAAAILASAVGVDACSAVQAARPWASCGSVTGARRAHSMRIASGGNWPSPTNRTAPGKWLRSTSSSVDIGSSLIACWSEGVKISFC